MCGWRNVVLLKLYEGLSARLAVKGGDADERRKSKTKMA
jgi:hypothetical protein